VFDISLQAFDMEQHTAQAADLLARNLRRLRVARRWSLSELAAVTGVGKATVSAIENGRANPTVGTLAALAAALEVEVSALLEGAAEDDLVVKRRAAPGRLARLAEGGGELHRASFEPGAAVQHRARPPGTRMHVLVTRGTLVAGPDERIAELGPGDYMSFPADRPHSFSTASGGADAVLVVESGAGQP
jgi:transcriptional regulator with XRE-family HTH domain